MSTSPSGAPYRAPPTAPPGALWGRPEPLRTEPSPLARLRSRAVGSRLPASGFGLISAGFLDFGWISGGFWLGFDSDFGLILIWISCTRISAVFDLILVGFGFDLILIRV